MATTAEAPGQVAPLSQRLGSMQGRLVESRNGRLDSTPGDRWREEFDVAAAVGLHHIELVLEREVEPLNPVWSPAGRKALRQASVETSVAIPSLCVNELLNRRLDDRSGTENLLGRLPAVVGDLGVTTVILPLLESSDIAVLDTAAAAAAVSAIGGMLATYGAGVALELGVPAQTALDFLDATECAGASICYDLGNAAAAGYDSPAELKLLNGRVGHIHAKDKNPDGQNVRFGTGLVPFGRAFEALSGSGYDGLVTMEATRGDDPRLTAAEHRTFLLASAEHRA